MIATRVATLCVVLAMHFCSPPGFLNATAPREGITVIPDVRYADGPRHTMDVYVPRDGAAMAPVVVFFYGGGWVSGDKGMYRFVGAALAAHGVIAAIPDYRLHPAVDFPAFVQDAADAVARVRADAVRFGGDPRRLFLMGHSAGAQIAALLALDPDYLRAVGLSPRYDVCGVIGLAGPYDYLSSASPKVQAIFGSAADRARAEPINHVSGEAPPMLLLAGQADRTVEPGNTLRLAARLRDVGARVEDEVYPDISHIATVAALSDTLRFIAPVQQATLRFIAGRRCPANPHMPKMNPG